MTDQALKVSLLLTGNELMSGDIVDSNSAMVAEHLSALGCGVYYKATIGDDLGLLEYEIDRIALFSDVLIVNGGLGPTVDDLTAQALANVLDVALVEHEDAMRQLEDWCEQKNIAFSPENKKQAILPEGIRLVPNATGSAPGFAVTLHECDVVCTPGVPSELARMLQDEIIPSLPLGKDGAQIKRHRFRVFGLGESSVQRKISQQKGLIPAGVELGFRASLPMLELKLQANHEDDFEALDKAAEGIRHLFGAHIVTEDDRVIADVVKELLLEKSQRVTFAESCTGGLISAMLTELDGASQVFDAGFVTYSNAMKSKLVGVQPNTLEAHGAVSEQVVSEMLSGALSASGADLGVAVSGVAGPAGGTPEKPVGTVWVAWGYADQIRTHCFYFPMGRKRFQIMVAALAFDLLRRTLLNIDEAPIYLKERALKVKP